MTFQRRIRIRKKPYSRSTIEWVQSSVRPRRLSGKLQAHQKSHLICGICEKVKGVTAWGKGEALSACCCKISLFWLVKQKVVAGNSVSGMRSSWPPFSAARLLKVTCGGSGLINSHSALWGCYKWPPVPHPMKYSHHFFFLLPGYNCR